MTRWAALPRSINAGKPLAMAELRALLERRGYAEVATLLASGNAVFAAEGERGEIAAALATAARDELALDTEWFVRSHVELAAIVAGNPFADAAEARPNWLSVHFFADSVPAGALAGYVGPERWAAVGRELYVDYREGIGRSKLAPRLMRLAPNTARNWNTVLKLAAATG